MKATKRPSAEIEGSKLLAVALDAARPDAHPPGRARLPVAHEHVRTPLVSPGTRLLATEEKATKRPSAEIEGMKLALSPWTPPGPTLTRGSCPSGGRARTRRSAPLVSPGTRLLAYEEKATKRPSAEIEELSLISVALDAVLADAHSFRDAVRPGRHGGAEGESGGRSECKNPANSPHHDHSPAASD